MYMDSYDKVERRLELEKLITQFRELNEKALDYLALNDIKSSDDCHLKMRHLLEQAQAGINELRTDIMGE